MKLKVILIPERGFSANNYIIYSEDSRNGVIIDPSSDLKTIGSILKEHEINLKKVILTHGHADHISRAAEVRDSYEVPILAHEDEKTMLEDADLNFSSQMLMRPIEVSVDELLSDGDIIKVEDGFEFLVIHTPGHTKGGICLKSENFLLTGDTLFERSIGRTDFPGGNYGDIIKSIKEKILTLPADTIIYPGHGNSSTVEKEAMYNPFLM